ncbi:MFS transporter [Salibacteraceae bacterium]|jgi:MFS transporter, DHA1 family, inner membrane transport protein|nr:MFS transporter [Flavobacteriales bacterium]MDB9701406.1 MFS transporter [Salibacteraceae bacterium]
MKSEKIILYLLAASQFTHIMDFMIIMPLGEMLMEELVIGSQQFSFLVASYTITAGITGLVSAFFVDSFDRKSYFLFSYVGFTLGTFMCGFVDTYEGLITARILTGAFGGVISSTVIAIVSDAIAVQRRAWGLGVVMTAFSMASAFGLPIGLYFAFNYGWNWPFILLGTASAINAVAVYFTLPPVRGHLDQPGPKVNSFKFIRDIPNHKNQWMALVYTMLLMFGHFAVIPFITPYLVENVGFERDQITWFYLVGGLATMFTNPRVGKWADRVGRPRVFNIMAFLSLIPILVLTNLPRVPLWSALVVTGLFFVLAGGRMVPSTAIVTSVIKPRNRGSFMSLNASVQNLTAGVSSIIAGILVTIPDGGHHVFGFWKVGVLGALFTLIAIWMMSQITKLTPPETAEN